MLWRSFSSLTLVCRHLSSSVSFLTACSAFQRLSRSWSRSSTIVWAEHIHKAWIPRVNTHWTLKKKKVIFSLSWNTNLFLQLKCFLQFYLKHLVVFVGTMKATLRICTPLYKQVSTPQKILLGIKDISTIFLSCYICFEDKSNIRNYCMGYVPETKACAVQKTLKNNYHLPINMEDMTLLFFFLLFLKIICSERADQIKELFGHSGSRYYRCIWITVFQEETLKESVNYDCRNIMTGVALLPQDWGVCRNWLNCEFCLKITDERLSKRWSKSGPVSRIKNGRQRTRSTDLNHFRCWGHLKHTV